MRRPEANAVVKKSPALISCLLCRNPPTHNTGSSLRLSPPHLRLHAKTLVDRRSSVRECLSVPIRVSVQRAVFSLLFGWIQPTRRRSRKGLLVDPRAEAHMIRVWAPLGAGGSCGDSVSEAAEACFVLPLRPEAVSNFVHRSVCHQIHGHSDTMCTLHLRPRVANAKMGQIEQSRGKTDVDTGAKSFEVFRRGEAVSRPRHSIPDFSPHPVVIIGSTTALILSTCAQVAIP